MIGIKRDKMKKCFQLILEKKYSDAKNLLKPNNYQDINPGIRFAIEGIIDFLSDEYKKRYLNDADYLKRLRQSFKHRASFLWSDDFDKEYFGTWVIFLNFLQKQLKSKVDANSIVDNPSKEPENNKAT